MNNKTLMVLCLSGLFCTFTFLWALINDSRKEWKGYQKEFYRLEAAKVSDPVEKKKILNTPIEIKQINVDKLNSFDRCTTCHPGVEKMKNTDEKQPFTYHPNHDRHPFQNFGCTVCHEGQGLATTVKAAHGPIKFWNKPLLPREYLEASCGKCHYPNDIPVATRLLKGRILFEQNGCRGCHKLYGKGGVVGTDLSWVGRKEAHDYDFKHVKGEHTPQQWLFEHFQQPDRISLNTAMKNIEFNDEDAHLLTLYMLSLRGQDMPEEYIPSRSPQVQPSQAGDELYAMYCQACHSKNGQGSTTLVQETVGASDKPLEIQVPSLNNPDVQDAVSDEFLRYTITYGRDNTNMNVWGSAQGGGLTTEEIDKLVAFIRGWKPDGADIMAVSSEKGDKRIGGIFYASKCASCHGVIGEGGIGISLNSRTFLAVASDRFLAKTIVNGRPDTAMPAWKMFDSQGVSDLITYIRSWQPLRSEESKTLKLAAGNYHIASKNIGKIIYEANCRNCHGISGEGDLGPSLSTQEFLTIVDNGYLYDAITSGRPGAGMPAWKHFTSEDVAALIKHIRSWQFRQSRKLASKITSGDWQIGRFLYSNLCSSCHGDFAQGSVGPQLTNQVFLNSATNEMLNEWVKHGKTGTPMRGFGKGMQGIAEIRDFQIIDIITYIRYLEQNPVDVLRLSYNGQPDMGKNLYTPNCAGCHGVYGEGASGPALSNTGFLRSASDGYLMATMATGRENTEMRPVTRCNESILLLDSTEVYDIIAYVRSFETTNRVGRIINQISAPANAAHGNILYESNCVGCHGPNGVPDKALTKETNTGLVVAPTLNNQEFLKAATDGYIMATLIRGRQSTAMRPFGSEEEGVNALSRDDVDDLVAYIRMWENP